MGSTTGDLRNNLSKLLRQVRRMKMELTADLNGLVQGSPLAFLPIIHHALMDYSYPLACWLAEEGFEMFGKNDLRFIESLYKVLRDVFQYIPVLTREQFLGTGFAERKMIMTTDVLILCQSKHHQLSQKTGQKKVVRKKRPLRVHQEVLTVHATCGLPSACSEQMITDVKVEEDDSVENIAPSNNTVTELTLSSSKRCLEARYNGTTSLPLLKSHSPVACSVVKYSDATVGDVTYDTESVTSSEPPSGSVDTPSDVPSMTIAPYSSPSPGGSWCSLLSAGTSPTHSRSSNTSPTLQSTDVSPTKHESDSLKDDTINDSSLLTGKVEQLTELVEKMSAKIVLLETRLQLMEGSTKDKPHTTDTEPPSLETSVSVNTSMSTKSEELTPVFAQAEVAHTIQKVQLQSKFLYRADSPETRQLIESLRNRANQTKKLLAAATSDY